MMKVIPLIGFLLMAAPAIQAHAAGINGETLQVMQYRTGSLPHENSFASFIVSDTPTTFTVSDMQVSISSTELVFSVLSFIALTGSEEGFRVTKLTGGSFAGRLVRITNPAPQNENYTTSDNVFNVSVRSIVLPSSSTFTIPPLAVAAVPEPETYAMLLAGLGLMGAVARRRRRAGAARLGRALS